MRPAPVPVQAGAEDAAPRPYCREAHPQRARATGRAASVQAAAYAVQATRTAERGSEQCPQPQTARQPRSRSPARHCAVRPPSRRSRPAAPARTAPAPPRAPPGAPRRRPRRPGRRAGRCVRPPCAASATRRAGCRSPSRVGQFLPGRQRRSPPESLPGADAPSRPGAGPVSVRATASAAAAAPARAVPPRPCPADRAHREAVVRTARLRQRGAVWPHCGSSRFSSAGQLVGLRGRGATAPSTLARLRELLARGSRWGARGVRLGVRREVSRGSGSARSGSSPTPSKYSSGQACASCRPTDIVPSACGGARREAHRDPGRNAQRAGHRRHREGEVDAEALLLPQEAGDRRRIRCPTCTWVS